MSAETINGVPAREYWRIYNRRRRDAARAEGVCIVCTVREASAGKVSCFTCRLQRSQRAAAIRERRQSA